MIRQDMTQQGYKIRNSSAMHDDKLYVSNVSRLETSQQSNETRYTSALF